MRTYKAYGKDHKVYENRSEVPQGIDVLDNWRDGQVGDWVLADDECIVQILKRTKVSVKTCCGTYGLQSTDKMDTNRKNDIHQLGGENWYNTLLYRENATKKEILFAKCVADGMDKVEAYMQAFETTNKKYARRRATILMKTERINKIVSEERQDVFDELNVDFKYCIKRAKDLADNSKNDGDCIRALNMIWSAFGVVEEKKVTEVNALFQGFTPKELEGAQRQLKK